MSSGKKRIDQFPTIAKENSTQIRQSQEIVSGLIGIFKEHDFLHELNLQVPEAKLPARLCGRWAEFVEGKPKLSTWDTFANWLEKKAKISESKQRWMLFVGATGESLRTSYGKKRCPIHQSTNHILQECKSFEGMLTNEKVKVVEEHKLCLCCLLPGHRLSKCRRRNRCEVENCDKRHHTLVHEVDLKFIERKKRNVNQNECQMLREIQHKSPWKVKTRHRVRLRSPTRGIANQRT